MKHLALTLLLLIAVPAGGCVSLSGFFSEEEAGLSSQYDDAGIKTAITSALLTSNPTKANDVEVRCFRGHVFLVGEADPEFRRFAAATARETTGVETVTTHWFPAATAATAADTALQAAIAEKLKPLATSALSQIAVDVWGGQAVLTGILPDAQKVSQALAAARSTAGVKNVTSYLAAE
ncbi:MAG: BON domain-containing protein [Desulfovibrio sp.]|jgi:osmotically-inducible protein OsmY|nr:BON domain-containing protein [Desulfovibrio sp.]